MAASEKPRSLVLLSIFALTGIIILCWLGAWQLQRMSEKAAFLSRLGAQQKANPAAIPVEADWARLDLDAADLTRVSINGTWLPQASATVRVVMPDARPGERKPAGFGRYLVTALRLDSGGIILVNRGFAPETQQAALPAPTGRADITGILRKPEMANSFTPPPDVPRRDFHMRDPASIAAALNLSAAPFMVEAERGTGPIMLPMGTDITELIARIPNNHLQYALTWFGLAATLACVFIVFVRAGRRRE
ncbi:MAG: SURF1 family protein [Bosea sp. (in: a-proteobacteria)]